MKELGCDYLATGHYVRVEETIDTSNPDHVLVKGRDPLKRSKLFFIYFAEKSFEEFIVSCGRYDKR